MSPRLFRRRLTAIENDKDSYFFCDGTESTREHGQELGRVLNKVGETADRACVHVSTPRVSMSSLSPASDLPARRKAHDSAIRFR